MTNDEDVWEVVSALLKSNVALTYQVSRLRCLVQELRSQAQPKQPIRLKRHTPLTSYNSPPNHSNATSLSSTPAGIPTSGIQAANFQVLNVPGSLPGSTIQSGGLQPGSIPSNNVNQSGQAAQAHQPAVVYQPERVSVLFQTPVYPTTPHQSRVNLSRSQTSPTEWTTRVNIPHSGTAPPNRNMSEDASKKEPLTLTPRAQRGKSPARRSKGTGSPLVSPVFSMQSRNYPANYPLPPEPAYVALVRGQAPNFQQRTGGANVVPRRLAVGPTGAPLLRDYRLPSAGWFPQRPQAVAIPQAMRMTSTRRRQSTPAGRPGPAQ